MLPALITLLKGAMVVAPAIEAAVRMRQAKEDIEAARDLEVEREILQQIWQTHQFQTNQRHLTIGAFVVGVAVLAMTYTIALVGDLPALASLDAGVGATLVIFLNRFDATNRSRIAVTAGLFRDQDTRLTAAGDPSRMSLIQQTGGVSENFLLLLFQTLAFWGFVLALIYAVIDAL